MDKDGKTTAFITYAATKTDIDYAQCDTFISEDVPRAAIHYKVNLSQSKNGKNLALSANERLRMSSQRCMQGS